MNKSVFSLVTSAVNMTLPAFAAERRAAARAAAPLPCARRCRSMSPADGGSAANPPHAAAAVDRWDGRTPDRYMNPAVHAMRAGQ